MHTTLSLDDYVLLAVKAIAGQQGRSLGEMISELARKSLQRPVSPSERNGISLLTLGPDSLPVSLDIVNALRDDAP